MYCPNCGNYNDEDAVFCGSCGMRLAQPESPENNPDALCKEPYAAMPVQGAQGVNNEGESQPPAPKKKKGKKIWLTVAAVLVIAAAAAAAVFLWVLPQQKEKRYTALLDEGNRYLEEMDYEKAEDMFLEAIDIEPKKAEPYVKLADIYLDTGERDKAKEIIADARENLPNEEKKEIEKLEEERKEELDGEGTVFTWSVEPEIEADDIYYLKETDTKKYPYNEMERQMFTDYAVIKQGDSYGLIDMDGEILGGMDYEEITSDYGYYLLKREEPAYEPGYTAGVDSYYLYGDEILPAVAIAGDVYGFKGAFYYCGELRNIFDAYGEEAFGTKTWAEPEGAIPVKESDITLEEALDNGVQDWALWFEELPGGYGIYSGGEMATDFIYDACGSQISGLLAVEQDGKWGYVDEQGNVVIPIEYDASWTQYVPQYKTVDTEPRDFCYAASEGHVVLVKDGVWEMRDAGGGLTVDPGVFEEIRPLHEGKCWVKYEGKWGVIELGNEASSEENLSGEEQEEEPGLSADSSMEEIRDQVLAHLNESLGENGGSYSVSDSETTETNEEYHFLIRYAMPEEQAEEIIANGGMPSANRLVGQVVVNRTTGTAVFEPSGGGREEWQLWENNDTAEDSADSGNTVDFSGEDLRNIAATLGVPEDAGAEIRVEGEPTYWDAAMCWVIRVSIYQDGDYIAGALVDCETKEPARDIYTYSP